MVPSRKDQQLLNSQQFRNVYSRGQKFDNRLFSAFILRTESNDQRLGITVTRKIGHAVVRNRQKRRLREVFRLRDKSFLEGVGYDLVINCKPELINAKFDQIRDALAQVLRRFHDQLKRGEATPSGITSGGTKNEGLSTGTLATL